MMRQRAIGLRSFAAWDFQAILEVHRRDSKEFIVPLDASFHVGFEIVCCGNSARFQRAGKCAGQSTSERGNHMIDRCRQRLRVLHAVIFRVASVRAELQRLRESFDMRFPQRPFLLN